MDSKKPSRTDLQAFFVKKAIPTQSNFYALIEGMLNQEDDGLKKLPKYPLAIQAPGDGEAGRENEVLHLYKKFGDAPPDWIVGLKPLNAKLHLNIADGTGKTALFIEQGTCSIGLGTSAPTHSLHVVGGVRIDGALRLPAPAWTPITVVPIAAANTTWLVEAGVQVPSTYKDARGIVRLRGVFRSGTNTNGTAANTVVARLDLASAPPAPVRLHVPSASTVVGNLAGVTYVAIDFLTNGDVKVSEAVPLNRYLLLDGLSFEAATP
jgi:hypothetical protein